MSGNIRAKGPAEGRQAGLLRMLVAAVNEYERELARVSGVLHDEVSQVLSAIGLQLDVLRLDFQDRAPEIVDRTAEIQEMLERVINQLRELSYELHPSIVERAGLQAALDTLAGRIRKGFRGSFRFFCDPAAHLPSPIATAFYKIAERAAEHCATRAECSQIEIQVKRTRSAAILEIRADCDLSRSTPDSGDFFHLMMEYYAGQSNIALNVKRSPGKGTLIRATCPTAAGTQETG